jgi:hypothetical protein
VFIGIKLILEPIIFIKKKIMKKLIIFFIAFLTVSNVNAQLPLNKIYSNANGAFLLKYPSSLPLDEKENPNYLVKIQDSIGKATIYVKKVNIKTIIDATELLKGQLEPAWVKGGSMIVILPASAKEITKDQLAIKNANSGYYSLIKTTMKENLIYTGYTFLINGYDVYEIKTVMYNYTLIDLIKTLPKIAFSVNILR